LISCGAYKCVFGSNASESKSSNSLSNSNSNSIGSTQTQIRYGYTISQQSYRNQSFEHLFEATELAQRLSDTFRINHLLQGPPRRFHISQEQIHEKGLDKHTDQRRRVRFVPTDPDDLNNTLLIVQPIQLAPANTLAFNCAKGKKLLFKALDDYLASANATATATATTLQPSRLEFATRMLTDLDASLKMLNSTMGSCLKYDFQILIDPETGRLYHFDIDRCFDKHMPIVGWVWEKCYRSLHQYLHTLIDSKPKR